MSPGTESTLDPFNTDGKACEMEWHSTQRGDVPVVSDLPSIDFSKSLFYAAKSYFGLLNHLIGESTYLKDLDELYENPARKAASCRLWYAQHLLILAFGKAFVLRRRCARGKPPGHAFAERAMTLLPRQGDLGGDLLLSVQVLVLAAVYLQSIDLRVAAFQYVSFQVVRSSLKTSNRNHRLGRRRVFVCV